MKQTRLVIGTCLLIGALAVPALAQDQSNQKDQSSQSARPSAQPSPTGRQTVKMSEMQTAKATVTDVDRENRTVTLKGDNGQVVTIKAGDQVKNFDQIKKGDRVTAKYYQAVAVGLRKSDEPPSMTEQQDVYTAQPGEQPAGVVIKTIHATATIENIDPAKREVTLKGPDGTVQTVKVDPSVQNLDRLKPGDQVVATYTQALGIAVTPPQQ